MAGSPVTYWLGVGRIVGQYFFGLVRGDTLQRDPRTADLGRRRASLRHRGFSAAPALLRRNSRPSLTQWGEGLVFSLLWGVPFVLLVALGLKLTSAAEAASIAPTTMPVFAGLFAWAFFKERQGPARWLGYSAILAGLACLVAVGADTRGSPSFVGIGALAAAGAMWTIYAVLFRRSRLTPIQVASLICIWSAALLLPVYLLLGLSRLGHASMNEIALQVAYQGVLMGGVVIVTFNRAISVLGASAATAIVALVPATASTLALPILRETPLPAECAAIVVFVIGVLLASSRAVSSRSPQP